MSVTLIGMGHFWITSTFLGSVCIPFPDTVWPKYIKYTSTKQKSWLNGHALSGPGHDKRKLLAKS